MHADISEAPDTARRQVGVAMVFAAVAVMFLINLIGNLLVPFLLGLILALISTQIVRTFSRVMPRWLAALLTTALILAAAGAALTGLGYVFADDLREFFQRVPQLAGDVITRLRTQAATWGVPGEYLPSREAVQQFLSERLSGVAMNAGTWASVLGGTLRALLFTILVPVVMFFLLKDDLPVTDLFRKRLPKDHFNAVMAYWARSKQRLQAWLRGQFFLVLSQGVLHAVGLTLIGLNFAIPIGILTGISALIPTIGNLAMFLVAMSVAITQFESIWPMIGVAAVYGASQTLESLVLAPYLVGSQIKLHPLLTIFLVLAAASQLGIVGAFLILPLFAFVGVAFEFMERPENDRADRLPLGEEDRPALQDQRS